MADDTCPFCDILAGKLPASFIHQDESCAAFLDIRPINRGHILIVPVWHARGLKELDPDDGTRIFQIAQRMAIALRESSLAPEGINLHLADGAVASQEVLHVYLHVIPRYRNDGFGLQIGPNNGRAAARNSLEDVASLIRSEMSL